MQANPVIGVNFARDVVDQAPRDRLALIELKADGARREWRFGEVTAASASLASKLSLAGVGRGDVVLTLIGNRAEWALTLVACFRIGAVVLACSEQLRPADLRTRLKLTDPRAIVCDERNRATLEAAGGGGSSVLWIPDPTLFDGDGCAPVDLDPSDPCLLTFTSGTSGPPKAAVHVQRYLGGQHLQATHWLDARPGDVVWCTAATGWSKSARNAIVAPWLRGATAVLHDARFDADERLELLDREQVNVLCMSPTEYRMIAKRARRITRPRRLRGLVAAGEALDAEVLGTWHDATGLWIRDGFGQTETGQLTGMPLGMPAVPGSMGRPLPGIRTRIDGGELVVDPASVPTFFAGYLGAEPPQGEWRTGDHVVEGDDGYLFFTGRGDDVIVSAGYRIGPFEVESALVSHPAVADAAVVAAPDDERGSIVRAVVVLREWATPSSGLVSELQAHVRAQTAPYKYPRRVDFATELPRTASGKIRRALLRQEAST